MMTDFEKIAHLIRFGLPLKKINKETIIEWADKKIRDENDESFYDLSLARDSNKIIEFFSQKITWDFNNPQIRLLILSYYREYLKNNDKKWFEIEQELFNYFSLLDYGPGEQYEDFLYYLTDDISLRKEGYASFMFMPNDLINELSTYSDYNKLTELLLDNNLKGYEVHVA